MQRREIYDTETGFQYLRARYYNPETGRFTTRDTWGGNQSNPITLNKYLYGNGNPVMMVDPSGEFGTLADTMIAQEIRMILTFSQVTLLKMNGYMSITVETVWGIPKDGTAFKKATHDLLGVSGSASIWGLGGVKGYEKLISLNSNTVWCYTYAGIDLSINIGLPDYSLGKSVSIYTGKVYNLGNATEYNGNFYSLSVSSAKNIFGKVIEFIPLNGNIFSSGQPNKSKYGSYGWAVGTSTSDGFSLSASLTNYKLLTENCHD